MKDAKPISASDVFAGIVKYNTKYHVVLALVTKSDETGDYILSARHFEEEHFHGCISLIQTFKPKRIGFDAWGINELAQYESMMGAPLIEIRMGIKSTQPACKFISQHFKQGDRHVYHDDFGNLRPMKDPISQALAVAVASALNYGKGEPDEQTIKANRCSCNCCHH